MRGFESDGEPALGTETEIDMKVPGIKAGRFNSEDEASRTKAAEGELTGIGRIGLLEQSAAFIAETHDSASDWPAFGLRRNSSTQADSEAGRRMRASWGGNGKTKDERRHTQKERSDPSTTSVKF